MKNLLVIFLLIFWINLLTAETISQTYNFELPKIIADGEYSEFNYQDCYNFGKEGEPNLPNFSTHLLLPQGHEIIDIKIISSAKYSSMDGITIKPASKQFPISTGKHLDYFVKPNEKIYSSSDSYPAKVINNSNTQFLSGHSIASFTICPVSYIPAEKQVEFLKNISIEIVTGRTNKAISAESFLRNSHKIEKRVTKLVENPEDLTNYIYPLQYRDVEEDILIITNNTLLPSFNDYIEFKESTGFITEAVTTEYIETNYTGTDSQEKIRNCIIDHYTNNGISYVILGGDADVDTPSDLIVPHRGMSAVDDDDIPSDMYYAGLDGNWNTDGDGIWGETNEWDLYAEVTIGRLSVDSSTEIANFIHKLEMYQDSPVVADIEKALMLGEELNDAPQTNGGTYKNEIVTGGSFNGYTTAGIPGNISVSTLYQMDLSYSISDIFDHFNTTGLNLMNHLGHSNVNYNMLMYTSDITTTNFTNDGISKGYVIGYSQGCYNGSFDNRSITVGSYYSEDSFAEKITTLETAEVAAIANSRYGWYHPGGTNSSSQYYDRQFYDAIFGQDITGIGEANRYSKEEDITRIEGDEYMRWTAYELNLFGDPSMDIWTDVPTAMTVSYPASVSLGMSSIQFTTDAPYARIGLIQNGEIIGRVVAGVSGDVTVNLFAPIIDASEISVSIIAHNKLRHQGTILVVSDEAFVIYDSHLINDPTGNNDGFADYGENVTLDMTLENVGTHDALGVNAVLSTTDSYVSVTDDTQSYGSISVGLTSEQTDAFALSIANDIPDQHIVNFDLEVTGTSSRETWNSSFTITVDAPEITFDDILIDDSGSIIDENGRLDPGETVDLIIPTNNDGHSNSPSAFGVISCTNTDITFNGNTTHDFGIINASSSENAVFNITVDPGAEIGSNAPFEFTVTAGNYNAVEIFNESIGLIVENFESGNFSVYPWEEETDWLVVTEDPHDGAYCAKSGFITHNQTSELIVSGDVLADGTISFFKKVSSESGYDFLKFYINNIEKGSWSGEEGWSEVYYAVTAGTDVEFKWEYAKDGSVDNGSDCAWIDEIIFPFIYFPTPADITVNAISFEKTLLPDESASDVLEIGNVGELPLGYTANISYSVRSVTSESIELSKLKNSLINNGKISNPSSRAYCDSYATSTIDSRVDGVQFSDVNTYDQPDQAETYTDWTHLVANVEQGLSYDLTIWGGDDNTSTYTKYADAFIDWNQDSDFEDAGEWIYVSTTTVTTPGPFDVQSIMIPEDALVGQTRMRVIVRESGHAASGCDVYTYGETEDYTINVQDGSGMSWLTLDEESSVSGVISGSDPDDVIVGFNSTGLLDGDYEADITINSDDPDEAQIIIPVTLTVVSIIPPTEPLNISISFSGSELTLSWDAVDGATSYKVFSSEDPSIGFTEDTSGSFSAESWSAPISVDKRFYYIKAVN